MRHPTPRLPLLLVVFCTLSPVSAETLTGKVVSIADGDTFTLLTEGNKMVRIRLHSVDAPEATQAFGAKSKQFTSDRVFGKEVRVEVKETDPFGRSVGVVTIGETNLNLELVKAGLAWWYHQYGARESAIAEAEQKARAERLGL